MGHLGIKTEKDLAEHYDVLAEKYDKQYQSSFKAKLRNQVIFSTLKKVITKKPSKILDAGGGNGFYSIPLAVEGHKVTILDISRKACLLKHGKKPRKTMFLKM